jgi:hypothetical protein
MSLLWVIVVVLLLYALAPSVGYFGPYGYPHGLAGLLVLVLILLILLRVL